jgi:DNA-binding NtrC family response regulator
MRRLPVAHILVIDDDKGFGNALVQFLMQDRHQVTVTNSTTENMLCVGKDKIDLIVTGILTECEQVLETVATLAKASGCVPVIALAGARGLMSGDRNSESASLLGINVNVVRNFVRADLREAIAVALG